MGYVSRLLAMSIRTAARQHREMPAGAMPAPAEPSATETETDSHTVATTGAGSEVPVDCFRRAPSRTAESRPSEEVSRSESAAPESRPRAGATQTPDVTERAQPAPIAPPRVTTVNEAAPIPKPQPTTWLRENADDPLESIGAADELRDVLRAVRRWTSGGPVEDVARPEPIVIASVELPVGTLRAAPPVSASAEVQQQNDLRVSIESVTITVEDVPATPSRRPAVREPTTPSTRLARHYIRGT